jgi:hypothetical protein
MFQRMTASTDDSKLKFLRVGDSNLIVFKEFHGGKFVFVV